MIHLSSVVDRIESKSEDEKLMSEEDISHISFRSSLSSLVS